MKAYTDLEQSKTLSKILPLEIADMWYHGHCSPWESEREYDSEACPFHSMRPNWDKPCWSLAALLEYLRKHDLFPEIKDADDYILMDITFYDENEVVGKVINPVHFIRAEGKNILDACYEMILKLHDKNLI